MFLIGMGTDCKITVWGLVSKLGVPWTKPPNLSQTRGLSPNWASLGSFHSSTTQTWNKCVTSRRQPAMPLMHLLPGSDTGTLGACSHHFRVTSGAARATLTLPVQKPKLELRRGWGFGRGKVHRLKLAKFQSRLWLGFRSMPAPSFLRYTEKAFKRNF